MVPKVPTGRAVPCVQTLIEFPVLTLRREYQKNKNFCVDGSPNLWFSFTVSLPRQGMPNGADFIRTPSAFIKQSHNQAMATQLIDLAEVERLSPLVIRVLAGNPGKVYLFSPH